MLILILLVICLGAFYVDWSFVKQWIKDKLGN